MLVLPVITKVLLILAVDPKDLGPLFECCFVNNVWSYEALRIL